MKYELKIKMYKKCISGCGFNTNKLPRFNSSLRIKIPSYKKLPH